MGCGGALALQVTKTDYHLVAAAVVPLPIWWVGKITTNSLGWNAGYLNNGLAGAISLFLLIPIAEEVVFRGFLQGGLLRKVWFRQASFGLSRANQLTSLVFALAHLWQHPLWLFPGYFGVSLVLGYFRERYRGLMVPVLLHSYFNVGLWAFAG
jgi:membrane protease YdiL (CAAX protease family)